MSFCGTRPQESKRQKSINAYLQAVEVMTALKKDGKLDEVCKVKAIPMPLYKNVIAIVWGNNKINYGFASKEIRKISLKQVIKNDN